MSTSEAKHRRGATFDISGVITVRDNGVVVPDLTGWTGACKIKTLHGRLVADVDFSWVNAAQRVARLRVQDTSNWPVEKVETDILLTSPTGDKVPTDKAQFTVTHGVT